MSATLDIDLLRTFVAIAERESLSRAAHVIGRTQSAVSLQVRRLEEGLGHVLLERTGRGVRLTSAGERLLAHARRLLRSHDEILADMTGEGLSGIVRLGCPDDYASALLAPLLRSFALQYPSVLIEVTCAPTPQLRRLVAGAELDLALVTVSGGQPGPALRREPLVWVASADGRAAQASPLPLALSHPESVDHRAAREALDAAGIAYRVAYSSGSAAGVLGVVRAGLAVAVLARSAVPKDFRILPFAIGTSEPLCGTVQLPSLLFVDIVLALPAVEPSRPVAALISHATATLPMIE